MLPLAYEALRRGALYPVVYNAANETAVSLFLAGRAGFLDIPRIVEYVLTVDWNSGETPNLGLITETDRKAREIALHYCAEIDR
jgi:1-deoxy-D-xylulose-5-phosphate reductoisomerase